MLPQMVGNDVTERDYPIAVGVELTEEIIRAVRPIVHHRQTALVIDAFAAAVMGLLIAAEICPKQKRLLLYEYADRILDYAEGIE